MPRSKIIAHCLVKNEERFIWYALKSALPYVDQVMVWDTGSTDHTVNLISRIKSKKIKFKEVGDVDAVTLTNMRNLMIRQTPADFTWIMILDGDEVWPDKSIDIAASYCRLHPETESVVVRTHNLVGDIYHRLPESAGGYHLAGQTGHLNLRFMNIKKVTGLHVEKPHGQQGYYDSDGVLIQDRNPQKIKFLDLYYHHASHLPRSVNKASDALVPKRPPKQRCELGESIPRAEIPAVFFEPRPDLVPDVTAAMSLSFFTKALLLTPFRRMKRILIKARVGY